MNNKKKKKWEVPLYMKLQRINTLRQNLFNDLTTLKDVIDINSNVSSDRIQKLKTKLMSEIDQIILAISYEHEQEESKDES